jgi:hypothetical protein
LVGAATAPAPGSKPLTLEEALVGGGSPYD